MLDLIHEVITTLQKMIGDNVMGEILITLSGMLIFSGALYARSNTRRRLEKGANLVLAGIGMALCLIGYGAIKTINSMPESLPFSGWVLNTYFISSFVLGGAAFLFAINRLLAK